MVDSEVVFANASSVANTSSVENTLVEAVNSSNSNFTLNVAASSVSATSKNSLV